MNRCLPLSLVLLSLLVVPAHAGSPNARMEVRFVVKAACTVNLAQPSAMPDVACNDASPYRVAPAASQGSAAWSVTF